MTDRPRRPRLQPRKNPTQPRAAGTVAAIVEAAAQVLETRGIEGFNTNAVAERAGVSIGSLYQYFPGKDALTVALMQRETQRFVEDMDRAMAEPDGMVALGLLIGAAVRQQLQRPMLARLLDEQEASPALRDAVDCDGMDTPWRRSCGACCRRAMLAPRTRPSIWARSSTSWSTAPARAASRTSSASRRACAPPCSVI
ncbi:TetR/AcrR family transcriptional regulator [Burkholderia gladioli]|uniref:TetR/AcrR family transcriptional regulator n=1 Tax=Burkholderia gladioli TaxID=28095 RepID=UPI003C7A0D9D